jgi:hypothetical protein
MVMMLLIVIPLCVCDHLPELRRIRSCVVYQCDWLGLGGRLGCSYGLVDLKGRIGFKPASWGQWDDGVLVYQEKEGSRSI